MCRSVLLTAYVRLSLCCPPDSEAMETNRIRGIGLQRRPASHSQRWAALQLAAAGGRRLRGIAPDCSRARAGALERCLAFREYRRAASPPKFSSCTCELTSTALVGIVEFLRGFAGTLIVCHRNAGFHVIRTYHRRKRGHELFRQSPLPVRPMPRCPACRRVLSPPAELRPSAPISVTFSRRKFVDRARHQMRDRVRLVIARARRRAASSPPPLLPRARDR